MGALIYEIYPAAIGTFNDITKLIPQIAKNIGPDFIWLSPCFQSPWEDGGYDVSDYYEVNSRFGTMADFNELVATAREFKIGILLDLVLHHTSNQHRWFREAEKGNPDYVDYYLWSNKPRHWDNFFGGSAFSFDPKKGQYYQHLFSSSQPDLNFRNPRVIDEFIDIMDFWKGLGVAGFRFDSTNILIDSRLRAGCLPHIGGFWKYLQTRQTVKVLAELTEDPDLFFLAEPVGGELFSRDMLNQLYSKTGFDAIFNIGTLDVADTSFSRKDRLMPINYKRWLNTLVRWSVESGFAVALESHDTPRATSRFRADPRALAMLQFLLPCEFPCLYQGQEFGTVNPHLSDNIGDYDDVLSRNTYYNLIGEGMNERDAIEVVKHWSRQNARTPVDWQQYDSQTDPDSTLAFYRKLIDLWRNNDVVTYGDLEIKTVDNSGVIEFCRRRYFKRYHIRIDLTGKTESYLKNIDGKKVLCVPARV